MFVPFRLASPRLFLKRSTILGSIDLKKFENVDKFVRVKIAAFRRGPSLGSGARPPGEMVSATTRFAHRRAAMTQTALTELQHQIEAIQREAFAEGYAAA